MLQVLAILRYVIDDFNLRARTILDKKGLAMVCESKVRSSRLRNIITMLVPFLITRLITSEWLVGDPRQSVCPYFHKSRFFRYGVYCFVVRFRNQIVSRTRSLLDLNTRMYNSIIL